VLALFHFLHLAGFDVLNILKVDDALVRLRGFSRSSRVAEFVAFASLVGRDVCRIVAFD